MLITFLRAVPVMLVAAVLSTATIVAHPFDRRGTFFHWSAKTWCRFILWVYRVKVRVRGWERVGNLKQCIYVSNHASWFDIPAILAGIPDQIRIMFKKELTRVPLWGWALKIGHYIAVDRGNPKEAMSSIERAAEKIRNGVSVLLFAEGTRTRDGNLQPFKRGAFSLAAKSGVPIVPLTINNSFRILPKGSLRVRPADIEVVVDAPIATSGIEDREGERRLMERVRQIIERNFAPPKPATES
jgi:1-acyl-sn-glycerol-3-phosphate acyltransferase